jgi:hypothetical protein
VEAEKELTKASALMGQEPDLVSEDERARVQGLLDTAWQEREKEMKAMKEV